MDQDYDLKRSNSKAPVLNQQAIQLPNVGVPSGEKLTKQKY